jgi:uncharacterized beta-barrel protein YwiB (DUF1934 family)
LEEILKKAADIRISGLHMTDGEKSAVEEKSKGYISKRGQSTYLVAESDEGIRTMIKLTKSRVEVKKSLVKIEKTASGTVLSELVYEEGSSVSGFYITPYGKFDIETETRNMHKSETEDSILCNISGNIKMNGSPVSEFNLEIAAAVIS